LGGGVRGVKLGRIKGLQGLVDGGLELGLQRLLGLDLVGQEGDVLYLMIDASATRNPSMP